MSATLSHSILVFGATGVIGTFIINALAKELQAGTFCRVAIFTSQNTVDNKAKIIHDLQSQGVEIYVGDVNDKEYVRRVITHGDTLAPAFGKFTARPFDTIISAVGRNAILTQIPVLEIAEQSPNIIRFFPSEYGTDIEYDPKTSPSEPPHQLKLKVRAYIRDHIKRLEYTYLVTGPYSDMYMYKMGNPRVGSFDVKAKKATLFYDGEGKVSVTSMEDVGKLLVAALLHPDASRNRALKVNSYTATPNEVVKEFEHQTGGEKWEVDYVPRDEVIQNEKKAHEESNPIATAFTLRRIWADGGTLYDKRDNGEIGFEGKEETLESQVKKAIEKQVNTARLS